MTEIHADKPIPGFYKLRDHKGGPWIPVAIWDRDGTLVCRVGAEERNPLDVWTFCAGNPVSKEDAKHAFLHGAWPGDAPPVAGDNSKDLTLSEQISDYAARALEWLKGIKSVHDQKTADMASNYRAELMRLKKEAEAAHKTEKAPYLEAGREVDNKWKPVIGEATGAAETLRDALTKFMRAEEERQRKEAEAARKAEEERIRKERERIEAEQAKLMREDPIAALTSDAPELPDLPPPVEPVKVQVGGQRGRKTGLRTVGKWVVEDYAKALEHVKDHPDVVAAVEKVARAQAKAGATVPGMKLIQEKVAA